MSDAEKLAEHERAISSLIQALNNMQQQLEDARQSMQTLYQAGLALEQRVSDLEACMKPKPRLN